MPARIPKRCRKQGCPKSTTDRGGFCSDHASQSNWSGWQKRKGTTTQRGYGASWRKLREQILIRDAGLCQEHMKKGVPVSGSHVDHIVSKANGGTDHEDNLQTLCEACHKRKTATERGRGGSNL